MDYITKNLNNQAFSSLCQADIIFEKDNMTGLLLTLFDYVIYYNRINTGAASHE